MTTKIPVELSSTPGIVDGSNATAITIDSNENVGIGNTSPSATLDVAGRFTVSSNDGHSDTKISSTSNRDPRLYFLEGSTQRALIQSTAGTSQLLFSTGSTERMRIDSGGDVAINSTTADPLSLSFTGTGLALNEDSGTAFMQIDSGNGSRIDFGVSGSRNTTLYADANGAELSRTTNHPIHFKTNNTERMRIDSGGALLVGKTADNLTDSGFTLKKRVGSDHAQLTCVGGGSTSVETYYIYDSTNSEFEFFVSYAGAVYYRSLVSLSDERKKDNIADITFGLDAIKELRPVSFDWKNNKGNDQLGFLAQEVETTSLKQLVSTYKDENIEDCKSLNKEQMIPVLVKAIQEQQDIIEDLKSRIETLEG